MSAGGFLWYAGAFLVALGILIVVHELGHFVAARACGVKVLRFAVGFGRPLLVKRWGKDGTEWCLAAFPLGGYVRMLDEREAPVADAELPRAFNRQSVGRRALIVVAGPLANLLLAVAIYWGVFIQGSEEMRPVLGEPVAGSVAARAGVSDGDVVRAVADKRIETWQELRWELIRGAVEREPIALETQNDKGEIAILKLDLSELPGAALEGDLAREVGLMPHRPKLPPLIGAVNADSPAARAGIMAGDRVLAVDGERVEHWNDFARVIRRSPGQSLVLELVGTDEGLRETRVVPESFEEKGRRFGRIGVAARDDPALRSKMMVTVRLGPLAALGRAVEQTWDTSVFSLRMIGRMIVGDVSWRNVSGPVTIADYAGQSASMGWGHYVKFLALISISLGVLNLLPIPILDGGHLLYYLAEILKGGPLSERAMEIGQQIGLALLVLLMAFAFYNDINRLVSG